MTAEHPAQALWTIGHSTHAWDAFVAMLNDAGIESLVDVRRFPGSRRNPQYSPQAMAPALAAAGIDYIPLPDLGGRRTPAAESHNDAWRVDAFRGYADYIATPAFERARDELMQVARQRRCAVMCAEAVWWRCHRRLIADDFAARGWQVRHIMAAGRSTPHPINAAAQLVDGVLRYPSPDQAQAALFDD